MMRRAFRDWGSGLLWAMPAIALLLVYAFASGWPAVLSLGLLSAYVVALIAMGVRESSRDWEEEP